MVRHPAAGRLLAMLVLSASHPYADVGAPSAWSPFAYLHSMPVYGFQGYLKNGGSLRFHSSIYVKPWSDTEFVRLDDANWFHSADSARKFTGDFDSLIAYRQTYAVKTAGPGQMTTMEKDSLIRYRLVVHRSRWLFPLLEGRVSVYSSDPEEKPKFMKIDGGEITKYRKSDILDRISDNPGSASLLRNRRLGADLFIGLLGTGAACIVIGFLNTRTERKRDSYGSHKELHMSPLVPIGAGIMAVSAIPLYLTRNNLGRAIAIFNKSGN
jgi:hypothetical protein